MQSCLDTALREYWRGDLSNAPYKQQGVIMRQVKNRVTLKFSVSGKDYYLKRHSAALWKKLLRIVSLGAIHLSEITAELHALRKLERIGISGPIPVAWGWRYDSSFIVTRAISKSVSLETHVANWRAHVPSLAHRRALLIAVADLTRILHACGINHRDLYLCHYYLRENSSEFHPQLHLIDLHRAQLRPSIPTTKQIKDLGALLSSVHHLFLTGREQLRFIRHYHKTPLNALNMDEWRMWKEVAQRAHGIWVRNVYKNSLPQGAGAIVCPNKTTSWGLQDLLNCVHGDVLFPSAPFTCELHGADATRLLLRVEQLLASQTPYHMVLTALWGKQKVLLKIFSLHTARGRRRWQRTLNGTKHLVACAIPTPPCLYTWEDTDEQLGIAIFQYLKGAKRAEFKDFKGVFQLVKTLGKHHLIHVDAHLNNFMRASEELYVIDTDGIRPARWLRTKRYHLAKLFARCVPLDLHAQLIREYRMDRNLITRILRKRVQSFMSRRFDRDKKYFLRLRHSGHTMVIKRELCDAELLTWLKDMRWKHSASMLKDGSRSTVFRVAYKDTALAVKYYFPRGFWQRFKYLIGSDAAWRFWRNANCLSRYTQVLTPPPIALIKKGSLFCKHAWVISEYQPGMRLDQMPDRQSHIQIDQEIQRFFMTLRMLKLSHGDTKASNFIISRKKRLSVLDLDSMRVCHLCWQRAYRRDTARFLRNFSQESARYKHYNRLLSK